MDYMDPTIAEELFRNDETFWVAVTMCPRLRTKVELAIQFYQSIYRSRCCQRAGSRRRNSMCRTIPVHFEYWSSKCIGRLSQGHKAAFAPSKAAELVPHDRRIGDLLFFSGVGMGRQAWLLDVRNRSRSDSNAASVRSMSMTSGRIRSQSSASL